MVFTCCSLGWRHFGDGWCTWRRRGEECVFRGGLLPPRSLLDLAHFFSGGLLDGLIYRFLAEYLIEGLGLRLCLGGMGGD